MSDPNVVLFHRPGSPSWYARWWDPVLKKRFWKSLETTDYNEARRKARELAQDLAGGAVDSGAEVTVAVLARRFLAYTERRRAETTTRGYRIHLRLFGDACGSASVQKVTPAMIREFLNAHTRTPGSFNRYRATLNRLWSWALQGGNGVVRVNPVLQIPPEREEEQEIDPLTLEEVRQTLQGARRGTGSLLVPIALGLYAGLRRGEICALRWSDVDYARHQIIVRQSMNNSGHLKPTKASRERKVDLADELAEVLRAAPTNQTPWVALRKTRGWDPDNFSRAVGRLGKRLGIARLTGPQVLRQTFASHLVSRGVPMKQVSLLLGHSSVVVTEKHYARFMPAGDQVTTGIYGGK